MPTIFLWTASLPVWFETTEWSKNRYVGVFFRNCYASLNFLCRSAVAHLHVWLTFAPCKCYQTCNQANSAADGQCQYGCFWSGCLMRSESVIRACFILSVSYGRYTLCKCSCCSRSQIHQSKESPSHLSFTCPWEFPYGSGAAVLHGVQLSWVCDGTAVNQIREEISHFLKRNVQFTILWA